MAREYFSHDYNARHDRKLAALVSKYKSSGLGIFWATCEMMHEEGGNIELDEITYAALSKDVNEDEILLKNVIEDCIKKFKLFAVVDDKLISNRVKNNLRKRLTIREVRSKAGKAGANAKQMLTNAQQNQAKERKVKERKVKEIKGKESKGNSTPENDFVCYDAEEFLLSNQIIFEKICMATGKLPDEVKTHIHKYHLWMTRKEHYPAGKKAVEAGIESWILEEKNFNQKYNGSNSTRGSTQSKGSDLSGTSIIPADKQYTRRQGH